MCRRAVSLVEVIVVLAVLGVVALAVIPRFTQAAGSGDEGAVLRERLKVLRVAIERYYQDHHTYPGQLCAGPHAGGTEEAFIAHLMQYTNVSGQLSVNGDAEHRFGPYLRDGVPACPVPPRTGLKRLRMVPGQLRMPQ